MIETLTAAEATVLRGYQAFATADMESLGELFHPDIIWTHHNDDRFGGPRPAGRPSPGTSPSRRSSPPETWRRASRRRPRPASSSRSPPA